MLILPYSLREAALKSRGKTGYSKLWEDIDQFNKNLGISTRGGHLEYFLDNFNKELEQFVAEFECVPSQVGAIVLINGNVVGIERAPNPKFWLEIWRALIRECYGSLAIETVRKTGNRLPMAATRVPLKEKGIATLDDIGLELTRARGEEEEKVKKIIRDLLDKPFTKKIEEGVGDYKILTIGNDQFEGQIVVSGESLPYCSIFTSKDWAKNAPWRKAAKFSV
jgi:hypothetical protein